MVRLSKPPRRRQAVLSVMAVLTAAWIGSAGAATIASPEQATSILVRAHHLDSRCRFLDAAGQRDLSYYAARAEIATASQLSADAAMAAAAAGRAAAAGLPCDTAARHAVLAVLDAARRAAAMDHGGAAAPAEEPDDFGDPEGAETLATYSRLVTAFYLENKCRHLSGAQDKRYWHAITRLHRRAVALNGAAAVAPMMRQSEAAARAIPCGAESLVAVKRAFAETVRR